jgi:predicted Zn finger-like uncharacterized protein
LNIVCENCNTVYRFDAAKIPPGGKKVRCSHCGHVFVARASAAVADEIVRRSEQAAAERVVGDGLDESRNPQNGQDSAAQDARDQRKRLLLRQDNTRYAVNDLATLQRWIVERRISKDAEFSEDGEVWEKVGDRMDLLPFFSIVDRNRSRRQGRAGGEGGRDELDNTASEEALSSARAELAQSLQTVDTSLVLEAVVGQSGQESSATSSGAAPQLQLNFPLTDQQPLEHAASPSKEAGERPAAAVAPESSNLAARIIYGLGFLAVLGTLVFVFVIRPGSQKPATPIETRVEPSPELEPSPLAAVASPEPALPSPEPIGPSLEPVPSPEPVAASIAPSPAPVEVKPSPTPAPTPRVESTPKPSNPVAKVESTPAPTAAGSTPASMSKSEKAAMAAPDASTKKLVAQGQNFIRQHKYKEAVDVLRKASEQSPKSAQVHKELGVALLNLADVSYSNQGAIQGEAIESFKKATQLNSKYAEAYHLMGVAYMNLDQKGPAANAFRTALANGLKGDDANEAREFLRRLEGEGN